MSACARRRAEPFARQTAGTILFRAEFSPRVFTLTDSGVFGKGNLILSYARTSG
ncbi:hypothetical protein GCM10023191_085360 [Actinoallomurus oryzae]|uniref:Uncharacterized protein n=1 Tax=Actinoallomurus oryzae TaxID=502180 RepID=A0ABP8R152_9ACTN